MIIGMVGVKCGMTRIFDQVSHCSIPVSVVQLKPNRIVQLKTCAQDGYSAVQVGFGISKPGALTKAVEVIMRKHRLCLV